MFHDIKLYGGIALLILLLPVTAPFLFLKNPKRYWQLVVLALCFWTAVAVLLTGGYYE